MFALPVSFNWDGVSNLVVEVCFDTIALPGFTQNCPNTYTTTTFNSAVGLRRFHQHVTTRIHHHFRDARTSAWCTAVVWDLNDLEYSWSPTVVWTMPLPPTRT